MNSGLVKQTASILLLSTGVFHLIAAATNPPSELKIPLVVFGVAFFGLGIWTRMGGRTAFLTTLLVAALSLGLGGQHYLQNGGPVRLAIMCAVDALILIAGGLWLAAEARNRKSEIGNQKPDSDF